MKDLLDKLSSYNIFNYLLPGIVFVCLAKYFTRYDFIQDSDLIGAFLYYFIGMIISRIGSLIVEPMLKRVRLIKFADYGEYVKAEKVDGKVGLLSEVNNTYRSIVAMILALLLLKGYEQLKTVLHVHPFVMKGSIVVAVLTIFLLAYRKQTNYLRERIEASIESKRGT